MSAVSSDGITSLRDSAGYLSNSILGRDSPGFLVLYRFTEELEIDGTACGSDLILWCLAHRSMHSTVRSSTDVLPFMNLLSSQMFYDNKILGQRMSHTIPFTDGDLYQSSFDTGAFLSTFCQFGVGRDDLLNFRLRKCFETFGSGGVGGDVLIDIGGGPSIYQLLSACETFNSIIATDFTDRNRQEFEKWLRKEPGAFDWSEFSKAVCELEGNGDTWEKKEEKLRTRVKHVLKCDVTKSNPLDPEVIPPADGLLSICCLEVACTDFTAYQTALRNISSLLKPGGHLVLLGCLGDTFYRVGNQEFFSLPLDEQSVRKAVEDAGYTIKEMDVLNVRDTAPPAHLTGSNGNFFLLARKDPNCDNI
ncbi:nicotinamide N-methyltransferase-like [Pelodytes ibericus]